jgi:hypothetical protein
LLICTFLRSSVIENNDLGWRGFLIPQFVLLLWSIDYVMFAFRKYRTRIASPSPGHGNLPRLRRWVLIGVWLGLAGTVYGVAINRAFLPGVDFGRVGFGNWWFAPDQMNGKRALALRQTYGWVASRLARRDVLLENPGYEDLFFGLYANRQTVTLGVDCGIAFGGSSDPCQETVKPVLHLFEGRDATEPADLDSLCRRFSVSVAVVKDLDPVWSNPKSWIWKRTPIYSNGFSKVFACPAM